MISQFIRFIFSLVLGVFASLDYYVSNLYNCLSQQIQLITTNQPYQNNQKIINGRRLYLNELGNPKKFTLVRLTQLYDLCISRGIDLAILQDIIPLAINFIVLFPPSLNNSSSKNSSFKNSSSKMYKITEGQWYKTEMTLEECVNFSYNNDTQVILSSTHMYQLGLINHVRDPPSLRRLRK